MSQHICPQHRAKLPTKQSKIALKISLSSSSGQTVVKKNQKGAVKHLSAFHQKNIKSEIQQQRLFRLKIRRTTKIFFSSEHDIKFLVRKKTKVREKRGLYTTYMYQVLALSVCVCLSLAITHPYSQRVFFIPSFVLSSFSDDDDVCFGLFVLFLRRDEMVFILFSFQKG